MNKKLQLVIFDLDGVITSTDTLHFLAWKKTIQKYFKVKIQNEDINLVRGISRVQSLLTLLKKYNLELETKKQLHEILETKNNQYLLNLEKLSKKNLKPHIKTLITFLKNQGILIGLGSASANAPFILEKLGLKHAFDIIVDVKKIKKPKPSPELFLAVARRANITNLATCAVIEDAQAGIDATNAAGMVAVAYGKPIILKNYAFISENHLEIKNWFIDKFLINLKGSNV